jgi:hypothetical protein
VVDVLGVDQVPDQGVQPGGVEPAAGQLGVPRLAGEHVHELQPGAVAVLQVGELVGEHHRVRAPVAVEHGDGRPTVAQHAGRQREDRGDARPGDDEHVVGRDRQVGGEGARRRQHLDPVTRLHLVDEVGGEEPTGDLADADPRGAPHRRADGVRTALVPVAVDPAQGERLPGLEAVVLFQLRRDVEGDRDGVVGQLLHAGDGEGVELRAAAGAHGCIGRRHGLRSP